MKKRRIAIVTGTRADYGLLRRIVRLIEDDGSLRLQLIVTGQHLMRSHGHSVSEIRKDRVPIAASIPLALDSDRERDVAAAIGRGTIGFAKAYSRLSPDLVIVLGDRFEILAAVVAALPLRIPVAHIHGGEATHGVIDEQIRHAVTKLSHLHFPAAQPYERRILRMGEDPRRVFCFGAPGLDGIAGFKALPREKLFKELGIPAGSRVGVVTFHPVTLRNEDADRQTAAFFKALGDVKDVFWILTLPNADPGSRAVSAALKRFARSHPKTSSAHASLGRERYLSLLSYADLMVGNSSSGLLEGPSFRLPVVNVGDRQEGRVRAASVIDVPKGDAASIVRAVRRGLTPAFRRKIARVTNPYQGDDASGRIVSVIKRVTLGPNLLKKRFHS